MQRTSSYWTPLFGMVIHTNRYTHMLILYGLYKYVYSIYIYIHIFVCFFRPISYQDPNVMMILEHYYNDSMKI